VVVESEEEAGSCVLRILPRYRPRTRGGGTGSAAAAPFAAAPPFAARREAAKEQAGTAERHGPSNGAPPATVGRCEGSVRAARRCASALDLVLVVKPVSSQEPRIAVRYGLWEGAMHGGIVPASRDIGKREEPEPATMPFPSVPLALDERRAMQCSPVAPAIPFSIV
jgi:hypothetical protein